MKTFEQIQNEKQRGDYRIIAEAINQSIETVKSKVNERRPDADKLVQRAFSILLEYRQLSNQFVIHKIRQELNIK